MEKEALSFPLLRKAAVGSSTAVGGDSCPFACPPEGRSPHLALALLGRRRFLRFFFLQQLQQHTTLFGIDRPGARMCLAPSLTRASPYACSSFNSLNKTLFGSEIDPLLLHRMRVAAWKKVDYRVPCSLSSAARKLVCLQLTAAELLAGKLWHLLPTPTRTLWRSTRGGSSNEAESHI